MSNLADRMITEQAKLEALRNGVDVRPGEFVNVEIDSRTTGPFAGHVVKHGVHVYRVHELDLPALEKLVETAAGKVEIARENFERDKANFKRHVSVRPSFEASFKEVAKRDVLPFDSVRVLTDEQLAERVAAEKAQAEKPSRRRAS